MKKSIKRFAWDLLIRHYGNIEHYSFWEKLHKASLYHMGFGSDCSIGSSGEEIAFDHLKQNVFGDSPVLFDVGANTGEYTYALIRHFPDSSIHCFEPLAVSFDALKKNVTGGNVTFNNIGFSDRSGEAVIYYDDTENRLLRMASLYDRQLDYFGLSLSKTETVRLSTVDEYAKSHNISSIDLLKLDVEGAEYPVLQGAAGMIGKSAIKAIQVEFGGADIDSRTYFRDFWNLLSDRYKVYRILKDGLYRIEQYSESIEIFVFSNYLFIIR
ncbi:MAG: FkbM family methyltransferase [Lachnospiraceae bacterium]|nr:FkbM family methyltransferase [Lachnospiraceae bacterium]